jgi:hypothetical protein
MDTEYVAKDPFWELYRASLMVLSAKKALENAQAKKAAALVAIHENGCPKRKVSEQAIDSLLDRQLTLEQISMLGLSPGSIQQLLAPGRIRIQRSAARAGRP